MHWINDYLTRKVEKLIHDNYETAQIICSGLINIYFHIILQLF